jgi:formylglycine-generating enzyme required for sulfatase activity
MTAQGRRTSTARRPVEVWAFVGSGCWSTAWRRPGYAQAAAKSILEAQSGWSIIGFRLPWSSAAT